MRQPRPARGVAAVLGLVLGLAACGAPGVGGSAVDTPEEQIAQEQVIGLLNRVGMASNHASIEDFARVAEAKGWLVVGVEQQEWSERTDVFGWLTFSVLLDDAMFPEPGGFIEAPERGLGPYCFRVPFDHYGKHGEFETADGIQLVDCPDNAGAVELPPDGVVEVAGNAREAAHEVLEALPDSALPSEDEIAAQLAALLDAPDAEHTTNAAPSAFVDGSDVGIAMGGADDCVLVKRVDGVVTDVYAPRVYLQPGELGCKAGTALVEDLSPPH